MNYNLVPDHMVDTVRRYVEDGIEPGGFFKAILCNDLYGAFTRADYINLQLMERWVQFALWELPPLCYGSEEKYKNWIAMGGLKGREE